MSFLPRGLFNLATPTAKRDSTVLLQTLHRRTNRTVGEIELCETSNWRLGVRRKACRFKVGLSPIDGDCELWLSLKYTFLPPRVVDRQGWR